MMQEEFDRSAERETPAPQPIYCWNYGAQSAYDAGAKPRRSRGALTFAIIMTLAFLCSFGVLIAVLVMTADEAPIDDDDYVYTQPAGERVIYVREYDSASGVLTVPEIAEKVKPSVVGVKVMTASGAGVGTGFIIREDGYIATNYHVIEGSMSVTVSLLDGSEHTAEVVGGDALTDLAVLKIKGTGYPAVEFGDSSALVVGELVVAIGTPSGLELAGTVTDGIVSAIDRNVKIYDDTGVLSKRMSLIQTNANINPGNSGGPLINDRGQVIGITTMKLTGTYGVSYGMGSGISYEGLGFALPINGAQEILTSIIETGSAGDGSSFATRRPILGIMGGNVTRAQGYPAEGVLVSELTEGYPSVTSGLAVGDIIVELNGIRVYTISDVNAITENLAGGDIVDLVVNRNGREVELELELGWEK